MSQHFGNVIGFASDGCNTMMGQWNSVSSRFKEDFPGVMIQKCICHSLALCASEACKVLPRRCEDLARDTYNYFKSNLQPSNVLSSTSLQTLTSIFDEVPRITRLYDDESLQKVDDEWRMLIFTNLCEGIKNIQYAEDFWISLFNFETDGDYPFKNVAGFVLKVLSLPHSSVDCERVFFKVNLIKSKIRNKLNTETMNGLLLASQQMKDIKSCVKFEPTQQMIQCMTK